MNIEYILNIFHIFFCCFSLNNSETAKAVTLAFCSIQEHFVWDILAKFGIPDSTQSPDIGQNPDSGISDFRISGQSHIKENCHNSGTSDDIDMKLNFTRKIKPRQINLTITSCRKIVTSLPFIRFMANLEHNVLSYKNWKQN